MAWVDEGFVFKEKQHRLSRLQASANLFRHKLVVVEDGPGVFAGSFISFLSLDVAGICFAFS